MTHQPQISLQSAITPRSYALYALADGSWHRSSLRRALLSSACVLGVVGQLTLSGCSADPGNSSRFDQAAGAGSGSSGGAAVDASCLSDAFTVCVTCHNSSAAPALGAGLDLQSPGVATRLVDVAASHVGAMGTCPDAKLIDSTNPAASWLLIKVSAKQGDCGKEMPLIGNPLSATQLACLQKFAADEAAAAAGTYGASATGSGGT